jgi:arylsulfatase A-like enzyme
VSGNPTGRAALVRALLAAAALAATSLAALILAAGSSHAAGPPPSFVVIMTDDQDAGQMAFMPKTRRLVGNQGATFSHFFASDPLCCPSRATFLTGQYAHNHDVRSDGGTDGGYKRLRKRQTVNVWLHRAGYRTAQIGKFLNHYGEGGGNGSPTSIPPGWDEWDVPPGTSPYKVFNYTLNRNGRLYHYGSRSSQYQTDVLARLAKSFIGKQRASRPFFLSLSPIAPHDSKTGASSESDGGRVHGTEPAPRYRYRFRRLPFPKKPSFNEADVSDKPGYIRNRARYGRKGVARLRKSYRRRAAALLAVDDLVAKVMSKLSREGLLGNTYVFFTSDNGFLLGEHRQEGKALPYEESVRVPLLLRGPGVPAGVTRDQLTANVDLAPTMVALSGATPTHSLDGVSLFPFAANDDPSKRAILLESFTRHEFQGVEADGWKYIEYLGSSARELYDLGADPYELQNSASEAGAALKRAELASLLSQLRNCKGANCSSVTWP